MRNTCYRLKMLLPMTPEQIVQTHVAKIVANYTLPLRNEAVSAANPLTSPPNNPVINNNTIQDPPKGNIEATFVDKRCSFGISFIIASTIHKTNTAKKPAVNDNNDFCLINAPTTNDVTAKLYQGNFVNKPTAKANKAVIIMDTINFIFFF